MLNFNGNNIGFTKFCQENVKTKLQKYKMLFSESPVRIPDVIKNRREADLGLS
jgi:hypothetical protein